ncbi:MAG: cytidylate kinase, partial [Clostridia bacterium]|nr:cytidylate kinase [Clostridia bacterium]
MEIYNIALDGPSGSGKSTVAKALSQKLGILYLDTGAMYRATAVKALRLGVDPLDERAVAAFLPKLDLDIRYKEGAQHTYLDGEDVSKAIREPQVSMAASNISSLKCVRLKMVEMQREIASKMSCVLDGRDIGSFVLP